MRSNFRRHTPFRRAKYLLAAIIVAVILPIAVLRMFRTPLPASVFENRTVGAVGKVWTVIGGANSDFEAYVDQSGAFQPGRNRYSVHYFVYDHSSHGLISPNANASKSAKRSLLDGYLPAPKVVWEKDGVRGESTVFTVRESESEACISSIVLRNSGRRARSLSVFIAAIPYEITGCECGGYSIRYDNSTRSIVVDGSVLVSCDQRPDSFAALESGQPDIDITSYIQRGIFPYRAAADGGGSVMTSAALRYDLNLHPGECKKLIFRSPAESVPPEVWTKNVMLSVHYDDAVRILRRNWRSELARITVSIPDKRYSDCFYASLAYLLILSDNGIAKPGAAAYASFWVRDFAYFADAFYFTGHNELIGPGIEYLRKLQLPNGGFRPRTDAAKDNEYDAPGQAIYAFVQNYRRTGDKDNLACVWPIIRRTSEYLRATRLSNTNKDDTRSGILPPSRSAEDIGPAHDQHFWDDFWAIRGLSDAAFAARELGYGSDAARFEKEVGALTSATMKCARVLCRKYGISYIPNGPEDLTTSAMARGTSCGLWPCAVLSPADPLVRNSFDTYWNKWIGPSGGGFVHKDHFWPYSGLDLAQCYLMLGQYDRAATMLEWTIRHDSSDGFFSWPEGMNRADLSLAEGDMPHGWQCAAYITLLRNMLVRESGRNLLLISGVPSKWLSPGNELSIGNMPTLFGRIAGTVRTEDMGNGKLLLSVAIDLKSKGRALPASYKIILPERWVGSVVSVNGINASGPAAKVPSRSIVLPSSTKAAIIQAVQPTR